MANSFSEAYIGTNSGQLKDNIISRDNITTETINLNSNNSTSNNSNNTTNNSNTNSNNSNNSNNTTNNNNNSSNNSNCNKNCVPNTNSNNENSILFMNNNSANSSYENTIFWIDSPGILFSKNYITELWPLDSMTREQKLNAITRLVILLTVAGFVVSHSYKIIATGVVSIIFLILTYKILNNNSNNLSQKIKETFSNENIYENVKHNFTNPTTANPIMNILLPEIQDNPNRLQAAPSYNKAVEKAINKETQDFVVTNFNNDETIRRKLFDDRGDKFDFECSMRQFYTTANTRVPNNQNEFARFCYGNMASCKDGDVEMCIRNRI